MSAGLAIGALSLAVWIGLALFRDGFWLARETDAAAFPSPAYWPEVVAVVPARDEADVIARSIASLAAQDYPGGFRILLVDDDSSDGTAHAARAVATGRLSVIDGAPLPHGWTGKLWAVAQGIERAGDAPWLWLTDADIAHAPDTLRTLVARAEAEGLVLHSLMAKLCAGTLAERALIPGFVLFFQMLYPFARVSRGRQGAAAGGCMLVSAPALARAGGIAAIRGALIDDCALGAALGRQGRIRLSLTHRSTSIRPYTSARAIGQMIARSAYAQLRYSPLLLLGTLAGLALLFVAPPALALLGHGGARIAGASAWALMALLYVPMLRFYRLSPLWSLALPGIGIFYAGATLASAIQFRRGRGGMWKGRAQARLSP